MDNKPTVIPKTLKSDQPPSSAKATDDKQEEWTAEKGTLITANEIFKIGIYRAKQIADAHNAELTAAKDWSPIAAENVRLTQELAAERQLTIRLATTVAEEATKNIKLKTDLLSALAMIEIHNEEFKDHPPCFLIKNVDLSALRERDAEVKRATLLEYDLVHFPSLRQHDARVCKPLVDAILSLAGMTDDWPYQPPPPLAKQIATDALAKVKP
jgi:hypothetical protein